ncbi:MAG: alpha/beta hydrolase, partial [Acidimicrobiia bacterium]|nr:alpha/beta hydrolase [Acidimicrobiia bacterium]
RLEPLKAEHIAAVRERRTLPWALPAVLAAYRSIAARLLPFRLDPMVAGVHAPTLLIHGRVDHVVPFAAAERLADLRPDWRFVPLDDVGHVAQMEVPKVVATAIDDWIGT